MSMEACLVVLLTGLGAVNDSATHSASLDVEAELRVRVGVVMLQMEVMAMVTCSECLFHDAIETHIHVIAVRWPQGIIRLLIIL